VTHQQTTSDRIDALEQRLDALKRKCQTGYACGSACISVKKECRSNPQDSLSKERAQRLMALAKGEIKPRGAFGLKPEQAGELAMGINKFQRTGIKPDWHAEPGTDAGAADELDVSTPEARMAFMKTIRQRSVARPGATYDGGSMAAGLLKLCDEPGETGRQARRVAKFLRDSNIVTVVDRVRPTSRRGNDANTVVQEKEVKHLLTKEAIGLLGERSPLIKRIADSITYSNDLIRHHRRSLKELKISIEEDKKMGWDTLEVTKEAVKHHKEGLKMAQEDRAIMYRSLTHLTQGKPEAHGMATREGLLLMRDDPDYDQPWSPTGYSAADMSAAARRHLIAGKKTSHFAVSHSGNTWSEKTLGTYVHELGHMVHFASGDARNTLAVLPFELQTRIREKDDTNPLSPLIGKPEYFVSDYSRTNRLELFAETFTAFVLAPEQLRKQQPDLYNWVDDTLRRAQQSPQLPQGRA